MSGKTDGDIGDRIAERVRQLRSERGYSLDVLAGRSGVSRSAISMIERRETSPTAVVLDKLATGLGVPLASLFDTRAADGEPEPEPTPVARRSDQPRWRDPGSGYLRRSISPPAWPSPIRIADVELPAGGNVSYDNAERDLQIYQQVWVLDGELEVTVGTATHRLDEGDCLAMELDAPTGFRNRTDRSARYAVVVVTQPRTGRRTS